eukprot:6189547-Pleurochrysis_carterae.AAC.1
MAAMPLAVCIVSGNVGDESPCALTQSLRSCVPPGALMRRKSDSTISSSNGLYFTRVCPCECAECNVLLLICKLSLTMCFSDISVVCPREVGAQMAQRASEGPLAMWLSAMGWSSSVEAGQNLDSLFVLARPACWVPLMLSPSRA